MTNINNQIEQIYRDC